MCLIGKRLTPTSPEEKGYKVLLASRDFLNREILTTGIAYVPEERLRPGQEQKDPNFDQDSEFGWNILLSEKTAKRYLGEVQETNPNAKLFKVSYRGAFVKGRSNWSDEFQPMCILAKYITVLEEVR